MKIKINSDFLVGGVLLLGVIVFLSGFVGLIVGYSNNDPNYVLDRVVFLYSSKGSCTGTRVIAPNGKPYTLTAAHCNVLINNNRILGTDERNQEIEMAVLSIDKSIDLMLLTNTTDKGFVLGGTVNQHDLVSHTGHGAAMPAFTSIGEVLYVQHPMSPICEARTILFFVVLDCIGPTSATVTSVAILPGASGGPLLDSRNRLIGIAHAIENRNPTFSYFVSLQDIKLFLNKL